MRRTVQPSSSPTLAQLEEMCRRKDRLADATRGNIHDAWALSWLALQSHEASRTDHSDEKHREATYVVLSYIVSLLEEAERRQDGEYTGVFRAVMDEAEAGP